MITIRYLVFTAAAFCLLAGSCKKDDGAGTNDVAEYVMLKPGNYWIYQSFIVDSAGNAASGGGMDYDSVYVEKDTVINKSTYHKLMKPVAVGSVNYDAIYLRDSANYIVSRGGSVVLAPYDFTTIFNSQNRDPSMVSNDSVMNYQIRMADPNKTITVPAGTFNTVSLDIIWTFYPFAASQQPVTIRRQHTRYAKGVGMISETMPFYVNIPDYEERRLIRYSVK